MKIDGIQVTIRRDDHGLWNFPRTGRAAGNPTSDIPMRVTVSGVGFSYEDQAGNRLTLPDIRDSLREGVWHVRMLSPGAFNWGKVTAFERCDRLPHRGRRHAGSSSMEVRRISN